MTREEMKLNALESLCIYDERSPYCDTYNAKEDKGQPRNGCCCDQCFYGKDRLALMILELLGDKP